MPESVPNHLMTCFLLPLQLQQSWFSESLHTICIITKWRLIKILFCTFGLMFQTVILIYQSVKNNCFKLIYTANIITISKYGYIMNCFLLSLGLQQSWYSTSLHRIDIIIKRRLIMMVFCTFGLLFQTFILIYESVRNNCFKMIYTANVITIWKYGWLNCYSGNQIDGSIISVYIPSVMVK